MATAEVAALLDVPVDHVRRRLHRAVQRGQWVMPARGLWVPVPPEYRTWGAPPGIEIIDAMMQHLSVDYYVGWLSAAALHGAAHQAPQVFQVAVSRQVRDRVVGRTRFSFAQREVNRVPVTPHPTRSGSAPVSTVAVTMLDVADNTEHAGGMDNAATVICELAELDTFDTADLVAAAQLFPAAAARRAGWILDQFSERHDLATLRAVTAEAVPTPSRLDPTRPAIGPVDHEWLLYLNRRVEPDL